MRISTENFRYQINVFRLRLQFTVFYKRFVFIDTHKTIDKLFSIINITFSEIIILLRRVLQSDGIRRAHEQMSVFWRKLVSRTTSPKNRQNHARVNYVLLQKLPPDCRTSFILCLKRGWLFIFRSKKNNNVRFAHTQFGTKSLAWGTLNDNGHSNILAPGRTFTVFFSNFVVCIRIQAFM